MGSQRHAGVHFPPPLVYVIPLGVGVLCHRWLPLQLLPSGWRVVGVPLGWVLIAAGFGLAAWAMITFSLRGTAIYPNRPATALVTSGPYRFSRNPMYVALATLYVGVSVLVDSLWPVLLLPGALTLLYSLVIRREERYLTRAFGDEYERYRARVRRWL